MQRNKTILIAEDEQRTREGLRRTLESWSAGKFRVLAAENGIEALRMAEQYPIHLLITDIKMPGIDGLELIEKLQEREDRPVVILISGYAEFEYARTALRFGVMNYLLKPLEKNKLVQEVEKALKMEEDRKKRDLLEKIVDRKLLDLKQQEPQLNPAVREAMNYVEEHLQVSFGLKEVASHVHMNSSYFSVLFKEQTGMKFSEYLTRRRMQKAKELLVRTRMPVAEVAEKVGYQTARYFIKLFKEAEGISPSVYRKQHSPS